MSAINVGEVYYRLYRTRGAKEADTFWEEAWQGLVPLTIVTPTRYQIHQAARLKGKDDQIIGKAPRRSVERLKPREV